MKSEPAQLSKDIVLIGGGHAHALVLHAFAMSPAPSLRLTLIDPLVDAPYTGMLPGHVAGHYPRPLLDIDLVQLARRAGARFVNGRAIGIDRTNQRVDVSGRPPIAYDYLSIDIGITSAPPSIAGFAAHGVAAKPLGPFADRWASCLAGGGKRVVVIGGGVAGVELSMAMAHALKGQGRAAEVTVIDRGVILDQLSRRAATILRDRAAALGVTFLEGQTVEEVTARGVTLQNGAEIPADLTVAAAGARPYPWLAETGLKLTDGFLDVGKTLQSPTDPHIYAVGDCAHLTHAPRPKAGVYAVRAAPVLFDNLRAAALGGAQRAFHPQRDFLKLVSLGERDALAEKAGFALAHPMLWRLKDRIDRKFMDQFQPPPRANPAAPQPLCTGCGAKIGASALTASLPKTAPSRDDVLTGPGDDAAVLAMGETRQVISVDHLRAVTEDPYLMAKIALVHALGDIWAMGATPQSVLPLLTLPHMVPALQARSMAEIMEGISDIATEAGAAVVGGHSSMGAEMQIGFAVTGLLTGQPRLLSGARPGDVIVLTRPLGSGTVLAGEMAGAARGRDVTDMLVTMATPARALAERLGAVAHAMTDVTGFGLAGHLQSMMEASGTGARVDLAAIPFYAGAVALAEAGIRASLWAENRAGIRGFEGPDDASASLLFDPQTAGGFLAALPREDVPDDPSVSVIGEVVAGSGIVLTA